MCAPSFSRARKEASRPVSRSMSGLSPFQARLRTFNIVYNVPCDEPICASPRRSGTPSPSITAPSTRPRSASSATPTQAQDVVQDVFLRLWRRPASFDASRGDLGTYLRLMGRSRALDLWRESQVRGRAAERLKVVDGTEEARVEEHPAVLAERDQDSAEVREALGQAARGAARGDRARVLGRADRGPDRAPRARPAGHRQEPHPARAGAPARRVRRRRLNPDDRLVFGEGPDGLLQSNARSVTPSRERTKYSRAGDP